jgi:ABC-2 type transport system permease protein
VNLNLTGYLNGAAPPVEGMTLGFSIMILAVWWLIAILISFAVFIRRDVY